MKTGYKLLLAIHSSILALSTFAECPQLYPVVIPFNDWEFFYFCREEFEAVREVPGEHLMDPNTYEANPRFAEDLSYDELR